MDKEALAKQIQAAKAKQAAGRALFPLGRLVATPGALALLGANGDGGWWLLKRHESGDWGDLDAEDWETNDRAVQEGSRILSAYTLADGTVVWVITEWDRSATTLLLPDEY